MPKLCPRALSLALGGALLAAPLVGIAPSPARAADPTVVSGDDWTVSQVAGGYQVVVDLDTPLAVRSDAPTVVVDGAPVGIATEAADGRSLSVFTTDPAVLDATDVSPGWASEAETASASPSARTLEVPAQQRRARRALDVDPAEPGDYEWTESIYLFGDQSVPLAAIGGIRGELEGKLYLPTTGGPRPTVVLLHGRHTSCYGTGPSNPLRWPCAVSPDSTDRKSIPSYAGYDGTARALASRGYSVVSISANAINSNDNQLAADQGAQARGQLVLDTLSMLEKATAGDPVSHYDAWQDRTRTLDEALADGTASYAARADGFVGGAPELDTVTAADLVGKFDLSTIGLMGHSRGGEGVTSAAVLNQALAEPWAIESVLPLAPVDFGRMTVPGVPMNVLLPYCDGDVSNQQGQHLLDDSRYAFGDDVLRAGTWVMGANHNFYNTVWTPGRYAYSVSDDWSGSTARRTEPICGTDPTVAATSIRMTAAEQYAQGTSYMTAWFRLTLGGETAFLPMFDGTGQVPAALGGEDVRTQATAPSSARSTITTFEAPSSLVRTFGTATATPCASTGGRTTSQVLPPCATTLGTAQVPHWTPASNGGNVPASPMTRMAWTSETGAVRVTVPAARRDASGFERLSVKVAADETVTTGTELTMTVVDGAGATWSSPVSALNPLALVRLPTSASTSATSTLKKIVLQQVNVPVATLAGAGLATTDLREVRFTAGTGADGTPAGAAYLSDLAFERSSVGTVDNSARPVVDVFAPSVDEGSAPGTYDLAVYLDGPATTPVTGYVSLLGSSTNRAGATMERVTFAPGETCAVVTAAIQGDTVASTTNGSVVKASVINVSGALQGTRAIVSTTFREDDGTVAPTTPAGSEAPAVLPPVGVPAADVCAERETALAGGEVVTAATAAPGSTTPVSAAGFRSGESVTFAAAGIAPVNVVADATGLASTELALPADLATGPLPVTATGFGTGRVAAGTLGVRGASTTTLTLSPEAPTLRTPVTLTATVTAADTAGTVEFLDGTTSLGTAETVDGVATLTVPGFGGGEHTLTAVFARTESTEGSTSAPVAFTLDPRASTAVLTVAPARAVFGTPVTVDVAVPGETEGDVAMAIAGRYVTVPLDATGHARLPLPASTPAGTYPVAARFTGNADAAPSAVVTGSVVVAPKATTTAVRAARTVRPGRAVKVTVVVGGKVAGVAPTGQVTLEVSGAMSRTRVKALPASGTVTFTVTAPRNGRKLDLRASYAARGSYAPSTSKATVVRIRR
ncbi:alpha/beta hydrolase family protein [Nocardioides litoris]|uniref:alpha/beta hydrolase family protein n=1 Tax=Nocardioides litoris TaxID=1926648 RepID=UPI00111E6244|nr:Ig-like domain-containing protein [Nocardioides litoris]